MARQGRDHAFEHDLVFQGSDREGSEGWVGWGSFRESRRGRLNVDVSHES